MKLILSLSVFVLAATSSLALAYPSVEQNYSASVSEARRLQSLSGFELNAEAYLFARDVRRMGGDFERAKFASEMSSLGGESFAVYKDAYAFAEKVRFVMGEFARAEFAARAACALNPLLYLAIYKSAYAFALETRHLALDFDRDQYAGEQARLGSGN